MTEWEAGVPHGGACETLGSLSVHERDKRRDRLMERQGDTQRDRDKQRYFHSKYFN